MYVHITIQDEHVNVITRVSVFSVQGPPGKEGPAGPRGPQGPMVCSGFSEVLLNVFGWI